MNATTYAIGDIHGRLDLLAPLVEVVESRMAPGSLLVFLGDYVDRGPESAGVLSLLCDVQDRLGKRAIFLKGNHEEMMLSALADLESGDAENWALNGGLATLESYGWRLDDPTDVSMIPDRHLRFLRNLKLWHDDGERFFVHAGVDPSRDIDDQRERDLLWIREPFLSWNAEDWDRLIVHGHTPDESGPAFSGGKLNLDTKAFATGRLAAASFPHGEPAKLLVSTPDGISISDCHTSPEAKP